MVVPPFKTIIHYHLIETIFWLIVGCKGFLNHAAHFPAGEKVVDMPSIVAFGAGIALAA